MNRRKKKRSVYGVFPNGFPCGIEINESDYFRLYRETSQCWASSVVKAMISPGVSGENIQIHPMLYEFLAESVRIQIVEESPVPEGVVVDLAPIAIDVNVEQTTSKNWKLEKVSVLDLPDDAVVWIRLIYTEPEIDASYASIIDALIEMALQNRVVQLQSLILLPLGQVTALAFVEGIDSDNCKLNPSFAFRFGVSNHSKILYRREDIIWSYGRHVTTPVAVPGYTDVVKKICAYWSGASTINLPTMAAPSGVIITGCSGVGKSTIAEAVASAWEHQPTHSETSRRAVWVNVADVLLCARSVAHDELVDMILPLEMKQSGASILLVLDDLNVLQNKATSETLVVNAEQILTLNAVLHVIDFLVSRHCSILGVSVEGRELPPELLKPGRLECQHQLQPPTEVQRAQMFVHLLQQVGYDEIVATDWGERLAPRTAGFVAGDMKRICVQACTTAWAKSGDQDTLPSLGSFLQAAYDCIPSQLAWLDVVRPNPLAEGVDWEDWKHVFELSWEPLVGYDQMKRRIYRSVVVPWRRYLNVDSSARQTLSPPSGVLFHGSSGCGKSLAARCLGHSLRLPMIQVRTADVLDKWLGSSESAIRTLFSRARSAAPSILFFDEIDSIASNRGIDGGSNDVMTRVLSTLLNEMDGISGSAQGRILVVACTNRLDTLDTALLRPGRLEEHILLSEPDQSDIKLILEAKLSNIPIDDSMNLGSIAVELVGKGISGASVAGAANESLLRAIRRSTDSSPATVSREDFYNALAALKL